MAGEPPRRPSATLEGQNPGNDIPEFEVPRQPGKEPMIPEDTVD